MIKWNVWVKVRTMCTYICLLYIDYIIYSPHSLSIEVDDLIMPIQPAMAASAVKFSYYYYVVLSWTTLEIRRLCDGASDVFFLHHQPPMMLKYSYLSVTLAAADDVHDIVQVRQSKFQQRVGASSAATAVLLIAVHHVLWPLALLCHKYYYSEVVIEMLMSE